MFHFEIDEKTPLRPRYRVKEVVLETQTFQGITVQTTESTIINNRRNEQK